MRFIIAIVLIFDSECGIIIAREAFYMIERPLYVNKIMAYVNTPFVKILTGIRRCGKSTILNMIMRL